MCTLNETRVDESILLLKILRRIPCERWISTSEIAHELDESGLHIAPRRLQRILKRITSTDEFSFNVTYDLNRTGIGVLKPNRI